ncbi:hypothetical protein [uncultured Clostridium sp.]|uniref:hypothetical protein n=2 Tax=uncultured Clostridium sp. TaxID=59620 RepID=UPI00260934E6|nr:hypothetical protein [uncultured Clostridium sp.]
MVESSFSIRKPEETSRNFYKRFYESYSLLQINDIIINNLKDAISKRDKEELLRNLDTDGEEVKFSNVCFLGMGIRNPSMELRAKENRGIDKSLMETLKGKGIDSIDWYIRSNEYVQLYAICEQAIKDYLVINGVDIASIREGTIINKLFEKLGSDKKDFLDYTKTYSNEIMRKEDYIRKMWKYFTEIRHLYMHAGGRITDRFKENMNKLKSDIGKTIEEVEKEMFLEKEVFDIDKLFNFSFEDMSIFEIDSHFLSFFRSFVIILVEGLENISNKK